MAFQRTHQSAAKQVPPAQPALRVTPGIPTTPQPRAMPSNPVELTQIPLYSPTSKPITIQAKLEISSPVDSSEREADRVAQQVVQRLHAPSIEHPQPTSRPLIQPKRNHTGLTTPPDVESAIHSERGNGRSLPSYTREPLEQAFGGADFSQVKIHADAQSDQLNRSIQAKAFTTGQDVFFRQDTYNPNSREGQTLIAHELTHVVQQSGNAIASIQRAIDPTLGSKILDMVQYKGLDRDLAAKLAEILDQGLHNPAAQREKWREFKAAPNKAAYINELWSKQSEKTKSRACENLQFQIKAVPPKASSRQSDMEEEDKWFHDLNGLQASQLQPGDVLLKKHYSKKDNVSTPQKLFVSFARGSRYTTHAALYVGNQEIAEASGLDLQMLWRHALAYWKELGNEYVVYRPVDEQEARAAVAVATYLTAEEHEFIQYSKRKCVFALPGKSSYGPDARKRTERIQQGKTPSKKGMMCSEFVVYCFQSATSEGQAEPLIPLDAKHTAPIALEDFMVKNPDKFRVQGRLSLGDLKDLAPQPATPPIQESEA